jgi:crossover junction endodeoxyribonuclease RusA
MDTRGESILTFVRDFQARQGIAPTLREISDACGLRSTSVTSYYLGRLQRAGMIERRPGVARSIAIVSKPLVITLSWPASALWPNRSNGHHWATRGGYAAAARQEAIVLTLQALKGSTLKPPLSVTYTFHPPTARRFDLEGAYSALKAAQDGIADALRIDDYAFAPVTLLRGGPAAGGSVIAEIREVAG